MARRDTPPVHLVSARMLDVAAGAYIEPGELLVEGGRITQVGPCDVPDGVVEEVAGLWERCLQLIAEVLERGVREGRFAPHDSWAVANILWTLANGLIQSEDAPAAKRIRRAPLERVFDDAIDLVLRGIEPTRAGV